MNRFAKTKGSISRLEDRSTEMTQTEIPEGKRVKQTYKRL